MTPPPELSARQQICFWMICAFFNEAQIIQRVERGQLTMRVRSSTPVVRPGLQPGSLSTIVAIVDSNGRGVAIAHCYRQPDGTIGYSGDHEPKWPRIGGHEYAPSHARDETCSDCATWEPRAKATRPGAS
jgi:hypothetical protein